MELELVTEQDIADITARIETWMEKRYPLFESSSYKFAIQEFFG